MKLLAVMFCLLSCLEAEAQLPRHRTSTSTSSQKPFFGGIVDLLPGGNNLDNLIGNPNLDKAWVDGFRWRAHWDVLQPDSLTAYDWSNTDAAIATVAAKGKKLTLTVAAGITSSPAIYTGKRPCTHFPCDIDGDGINESDMPFPDANYLAKWDAFVTAM